MNLLKGKKALIIGVANDKSIAYGIAKALKENGAKIALTYVNESIEKRVVPIAEELNADFVTEFDASKEDHYGKLSDAVRKEWKNFDILIHSIAYAPRESLKNSFCETKMDDFLLTLKISAYSLIGLSQSLKELLNPESSIIALTYYGSEKVIPGYNVMGVAKAALECSVRYMAYELGDSAIRVNAISAGPIKTLAASGIDHFRTILGKVEKSVPLKANISTEDVGNMALFLASDLSSRVTGQIHYVDSGSSILAMI